MEIFENTIDNYEHKTKEELNKLENEILPWVDDIRKTISKLTSFNGLPININYTDKSEKNRLPQILDMWPKPFWNKRKNIDWKTIENPGYLMICLNNRKFKVSPDVWKINNINIKEWSIILEIKVWFLSKDESYNPERMTKLLILLRTHTSGYYKDIPWTPRASVEEIK